MLVVRLTHLKEMPSYESILELLKKNNLNQEVENNNTTIMSEHKYERKNVANNKKYKKVRQKLIKEIFLWMRSTKDPLLFKQIKSPFFLDTIKELK